MRVHLGPMCALSVTVTSAGTCCVGPCYVSQRGTLSNAERPGGHTIGRIGLAFCFVAPSRLRRCEIAQSSFHGGWSSIFL